MNKKMVLSLLIVAVASGIWNVTKRYDSEIVIADNTSDITEEIQTEIVLDNPSIAEIGEWISYQEQQSQESDQEVYTDDLIAAQDGESSPTELPSEGVQQSINVDMSSEQYDTFLVLDAYLADPTYVSTLSLDELSSSTEFKSLPEVMQLLLVSKAIIHLENENVSKDVFYRVKE